MIHSKLIIHVHREGMSDLEALKAVQQVVKQGLISGEGTARGPQYCYVTILKDDTHIHVTKGATGTYTFRVS